MYRNILNKSVFMNQQLGIKEKILKQVSESADHSVFFIGDFADLGSVETIRKALKEAVNQNMLEHIAHGIYVKPMNSRFGIVPIPLETIAKEIALRDRVQIMPAGSTAANILGLSTQIPMVVSFLTTGSSRSINVGNRTIKFRHAAPRNFAFKGSTIPLIIQAFKDIGKENIGEKELSAVKAYISKAMDKNVMHEDILLAPQWIQAIIKPYININK